MKNNKGMTLVEIIISIALISILLLFLFMLLVTVNDINTESEVNSNYLINKSLILNEIPPFLLNYYICRFLYPHNKFHYFLVYNIFIVLKIKNVIYT